VASPRRKKASVTTGLKWAPETGPSAAMSTYRMPHVASVLPKRATAASLESAAPIMPDPMIVATRYIVPKNSAKHCRPSDAGAPMM